MNEPTFHCVVCKADIPHERASGKVKSVTCSDACATERKVMLRKKRQDSKMCRYCRRPSTPADRAAFMRFRKHEAEHPEDDDPRAIEKYKQNHSQKPIIRLLPNGLYTAIFKYDPEARLNEYEDRIKWHTEELANRDAEIEVLKEKLQAYDDQAARGVPPSPALAPVEPARAELQNSQGQGQSGAREIRRRVRKGDRAPSTDAQEAQA
jgi:predicted nucleic acid-binding Zn ribbon protein